MNHCDIEEIEYSLELPVGTRFYYRNHLYEVIEWEEDKLRCLKCAFFKELFNEPMCQINNCFTFERHDGKRILFREVKEMEEEQ